jgi:M6 family metalloprotease-like protein
MRSGAVWVAAVCAALAIPPLAGARPPAASAPSAPIRDVKVAPGRDPEPVNPRLVAMDRALGRPLYLPVASGPAVSPRAAAATPAAPPSPFPASPVTAAAKALYVFVGFTDSPGRVPIAAYQNELLGSGSGSVAAYFRYASYGLFHLTGTLVGGSAAGQSSAWLVLPHPVAYYADHDYGLGSGLGGGTIEAQVVKDLDAADFDWQPYRNAHGNVPYLVLVVSSLDAASTGSRSDLWGYESSVDSPIVEGGTRSGSVISYDIVPAYTAGGGRQPIGVFCHEFTHLLGALDMYDTQSADPSNGLGNWSLMGDGLYNGPGEGGSEPADLDAFTRLQLGWSVPVDLPSGLTALSLPPSETSRVVWRYQVPGQLQYYLIENREPIGTDRWLPGRGLLVYDVDATAMNPSSQVWINDCLECIGAARSRPGIQIVEADGGTGLVARTGNTDTGDAGDPFPGSAHVRALDAFTQPPALTFAGVATGLALTQITLEPSGTVTTLGGVVPPTLSPAATTAGSPAGIAFQDPLYTLPAGDRLGLAGGPPDAVRAVAGTSGAGAGVRLYVGADVPAGAYPVAEETASGSAALTLGTLNVTAAPAGTLDGFTLTSTAGPPTVGSPWAAALEAVDTSGQIVPVSGEVTVDGRPVRLSDGRANVTLSFTVAGQRTVAVTDAADPAADSDVAVQVNAAG